MTTTYDNEDACRHDGRHQIVRNWCAFSKSTLTGTLTCSCASPSVWNSFLAIRNFAAIVPS